MDSVPISEIKVYSRKAFKASRKKINTGAVIGTVTGTGTADNIINSSGTTITSNDDDKKNDLKKPPAETLVSEDANSVLILRLDTAVSDDSSSLHRQGQVVADMTPSTPEVVTGNGVVKQGLEKRVRINMRSKSKEEMQELRRELEVELDMVRSLMKRIEGKERHIGGIANSGLSADASTIEGVQNRGGRALTRVHSEVASVSVPLDVSRPLNKLRLSVLENSHVSSEIGEREKRTPKANRLYQNSEFLLAKDKFPPAESNKKSKSSGKKQGGGNLRYGFAKGSKFFKNCSSLLEKLMKHKHGWVFNDPVDPKALGLHDYFTIIKYPMDLGTVKSRLNENWYKSPREFAEDVRLTFCNALTYNPKGQDVHIMAEQLLQIFEDRWAIIELDYHREMRLRLDYESSLFTPTSRLVPPRPPPLDMRRILDRSESMMHPMDPKPKSMSITTPSSRTPALKKPKANDVNKRDMTYDEKQKLSTKLQSLPSEKLDSILQIIKKRNSEVLQQDDEIEVDIDTLDAETLWELDRFVTNYKKSLSKHKRKAERAAQARAEAAENIQEKTPAPGEAPKETRTAGDKYVSASSPFQGEKQEDHHHLSRSSSSSSSSSDSGSSSSDSDSDSSSSSGSDADHSPRT